MQSVQFPRPADDLEEAKHQNVSGADRGPVVYCHENPEYRLGASAKSLSKLLFRGARFRPGVHLGYEGAGSFR